MLHNGRYSISYSNFNALEFVDGSAQDCGNSYALAIELP